MRIHLLSLYLYHRLEQNLHCQISTRGANNLTLVSIGDSYQDVVLHESSDRAVILCGPTAVLLLALCSGASCAVKSVINRVLHCSGSRNYGGV